MALSRRPKGLKHQAADEVAKAIRDTHQYPLRVDKALWKKVKVKAAQEDIVVNNLLNEFLRDWVKS